MSTDDGNPGRDGPDVDRLAELTAGLAAALQVAETAGDEARAETLRGELALLEDLALPQAVIELRLHRNTHRAVVSAMAAPLPPSLRALLG